jgi:hypothetical protein
MKYNHTKECIWCKQIKNISDFDKYDKSSDGYRSMCNICIKKSKKSGYK